MFLNTERLYQISRAIVMTQSAIMFETLSSTSISTGTLYTQYVSTSIGTLTLHMQHSINIVNGNFEYDATLCRGGAATL